MKRQVLREGGGDGKGTQTGRQRGEEAKRIETMEENVFYECMQVGREENQATMICKQAGQVGKVLESRKVKVAWQVDEKKKTGK